MPFCHECLKEFELKDRYLIPNYNDVWECPHCSYPNHKSQLVTKQISCDMKRKDFVICHNFMSPDDEIGYFQIENIIHFKTKRQAEQYLKTITS